MVLRPNYEDPTVREGALLRIASDLLIPYGELGSFDRFELVEWLSRLDITPTSGAVNHGPFWVQDACPDPEPRDEVTILRREADLWIIGYWERGSFEIRHRFLREGDACRWMLHDVVSHHTTSMGTTTAAPHVRDAYRDAILAVLEEVVALVRER